MTRDGFFELLHTPFVVINAMIAFAISLWYVASGIGIGNFYSILGLVGVAVLFLFLLLVRQTETQGVIPMPFKALNIWTSTFLLVAGFTVFFLPALRGLTQYFLSPFALYTVQSYATFVAVGDVSAQFINIGILPPISEEIFWMTMALVGFLIGYSILKGYGQNVKSPINRIIIWLFGLGVAALTFALFHSFNDVYKTTQQFLTAAGFRILVVLIGFGFSIMEVFIGAHMGNNMASIITSTPQGTEIFLRAILTTPFGIAFFIYLLLQFGIAIYGIVNKKIEYGKILKPS